MKESDGRAYARVGKCTAADELLDHLSVQPYAA
jgi:hypothetical protein